MIQEYLKNYVDQILSEDLNRCSDSELPWEQFRDKVIFITGGTGMIGSQLVKSLLLANEKKDLNLTVIILVRNEEKARFIFEGFLYDSLKMIIGDVITLPKINAHIDYIIHGASVTSSKDFVNSPVDTTQTALIGSFNVLELAKEKKVKSFVYLSSLEIYGVTDPTKDRVSEQDYGYIDILNVRSSYSESKRMVENICISYGTQYDIPVKIARLCQTFGAGVDYNDNRVYAQFARCIIENSNIILHTTGETVRNYCYTMDSIQAILTILLQGEKNESYNVANEETSISIKDMAINLVNRYKESNLEVEFVKTNENYGYNPTIIINLNTDKVKKLGWKCNTTLDMMFERMIESMKSRNL